MYRIVDGKLVNDDPTQGTPGGDPYQSPGGNPVGGGAVNGPVAPNTPAGSGGSANANANSNTVYVSPPRDPRPAVPLVAEIGDAAPVTQRTAQGLNVNRAAPTRFTPSGATVNPGAATQAQGYQAPGARSAPQQFQHAALTIPPPPSPPQVPGVIQPGAYQGAAAYQTAQGGFQGENMGSTLEGFAKDAMANPNRYSSDWMKQALASINGQIDTSRAQGTRAITEQMAQRGLVGSGMELTNDASLEKGLDQNRLDYLANLTQQMAAVDAQDRATAGQLGLQAGEFGRELGQDRLNEGHYADQSAQARAAAAEAATQSRANFGLDTAKFTNDANFQNTALKEQGAMDRSKLQLSQQDIDLRAHQIQQDAIQKGQQMDLDQARDQANAELGKASLSEEGRQFNAGSQVQQGQFNQDISLRAHQIQQEAIQRGQQMDLDQAMDQARRQVQLDQLGVDERSAISDERMKELALLLQGMQAFN